MAGNIISRAAFVPPPPSYDKDMPGLFFVHGIACAMYPSDLSYEKTLLYSHGNSEDIGQGRDYMKFLSDQLQVNTVCYDYPGYGLTPGQASESEVYADIEFIYFHMLTRLHLKAENIFVVGRSLGSGPSIHLATSEGVTGLDGPAGLILISPITSAVRVAMSEAVAVSLSYADIFVNISKIDKVSCPVLIIHGDKDEVVPWTHGNELAKKCGKLWKFFTVKDGTHNNVKTIGSPEVIEHIQSFIKHRVAVHPHP